MNKRMGEVGALLLSMGLLMMGNGLQSSLIALRASQEGFSTQVAGLLMSMYFVGFLAGSTRTPKIFARVSHVRVFAALASLASSAVVLHPLFINAWFWCGLRLISGFCIAGLFVIAESWLNEVASNGTRGRLLSLYVVVTMAAMASGQMLLNLGRSGELRSVHPHNRAGIAGAVAGTAQREPGAGLHCAPTSGFARALLAFAAGADRLCGYRVVDRSGNGDGGDLCRADRSGAG